MGFNNNKTLPAYLLGLGMFVFLSFYVHIKHCT